MCQWIEKSLNFKKKKHIWIKTCASNLVKATVNGHMYISCMLVNRLLWVMITINAVQINKNWLEALRPWGLKREEHVRCTFQKATFFLLIVYPTQLRRCYVWLPVATVQLVPATGSGKFRIPSHSWTLHQHLRISLCLPWRDIAVSTLWPCWCTYSIYCRSHYCEQKHEILRARATFYCGTGQEYEGAIHLFPWKKWFVPVPTWATSGC